MTFTKRDVSRIGMVVISFFIVSSPNYLGFRVQYLRTSVIGTQSVFTYNLARGEEVRICQREYPGVYS